MKVTDHREIIDAEKEGGKSNGQRLIMKMLSLLCQTSDGCDLF